MEYDGSREIGFFKDCIFKQGLCSNDINFQFSTLNFQRLYPASNFLSRERQAEQDDLFAFALIFPVIT
jgi:hypothetical protein